MNRKIAELKGLCWHEEELRNPHYLVTENSNEMVYKHQRYCGKCGINLNWGKINPDWEHNIADAWELFEELPNVTLDHNLVGSDYCIYWWDKTDASRRSIVSCKTAPEAICKAYISWRENG